MKIVLRLSVVFLVLLASCEKDENNEVCFSEVEDIKTETIFHEILEPVPVWHDTLDLNNDGVLDLRVHFSQSYYYNEMIEITGVHFESYLSSVNPDFTFSLGFWEDEEEFQSLLYNDEISESLTWDESVFINESSSKFSVLESDAIWTSFDHEGYIALKWSNDVDSDSYGWLKAYYSSLEPWFHVEELAYTTSGIEGLTVGQTE